MRQTSQLVSPIPLLLGAAALALLPDNAAAALPRVKTGSLNPMLSNLYYETQTQKGYTSAKGQFRYRVGETVTLSYTGVTIASVPGAPIITPLDLSDSNTAKNQLHMLQALDTDSSKPGIQLRKVAQTQNPPVDYSDANAVAAVLAALKPGTALPVGDASADDAQLASTETALAAVPTPYTASTYNSYRIFDPFGAARTPALQPASVSSATTQFNAPFTLKDGVPTTANGVAFAGHVDLTLSDSSSANFDFTAVNGDVSISGIALHYKFSRVWDAPSSGRTISLYLYNGVDFSHSDYLQRIDLRDPAKQNMPPRTGYTREETWPANPLVDTISHITLCFSCSHFGTGDPDGTAPSVHWETSTGFSGDGDTFQFDRYLGQQITLTQKVTDDEGQTATKTATFGKPLTLKDAVGILTGKTWLESSDSPKLLGDPNYDPNNDYYYRLANNNGNIVEIQAAKDNSSCSVTDNIRVNSVASGLKHTFFPSTTTFVYEGPDELSISPVTTWTYTQQTLPSGCADVAATIPK